MEIWKPIKDFDGTYQVSNQGNVMGLNGLILKPRKKDGYLSVWLYKDGSKSQHYLHRLVAFHFVKNPQNKPQVNHKDGNKSNNAASNLEWSTPKENTQHAWEIGLIKPRKGEKNHNSILTDEKVIEIRKLAKIGVSRNTISEQFGIGVRNVCDIINKKRWKHL